MTQQDFVSRYLDEMTGLLLESFRESNRQGHIADKEMAQIGRAMINQQRRARNMLERMYDDATKEKAVNGVAKLGTKAGV